LAVVAALAKLRAMMAPKVSARQRGMGVLVDGDGFNTS
jgi:hypothetical protein